MPERWSRSAVSVLSRPIGAHTSTRSSSALGAAMAQGVAGADVLRNACQYPLEVGQDLADKDASGTKPELSNAGLVVAGPLLDHRKGAAHRAVRFEEPQQ